MKDPYELLRQKEADLARVRHEVESLEIVASLLSDDSGVAEPDRKKANVADKELDSGTQFDATGTDGIFSSLSDSRPSLWNALKRRK